MSIKKSVKNEVESALLALHQKIDSLKAKVDQLCESTGKCSSHPQKPSSTGSEKK